ncbi:hypothetical protein GCM10022243_19450 [Saccharothrix violaceirubra]|uniref:Uncharacterized protein n=1 Tax=Saccharothrix violaceirubra TaxID=413306 RepID=A0A7W7WW37_9PSEU|nr:hypothetical protein [Saccharothrix violaceirubra]MBB4965148.1 hypothetical protein [Saccharothrix violaceirubra]
MIYQAGGDQLLLNPRRVGRGHRATFGIALDLTDEVTGNDDNAMTGPFPPGMSGMSGMMPGSPTPTR